MLAGTRRLVLVAVVVLLAGGSQALGVTSAPRRHLVVLAHVAPKGGYNGDIYGHLGYAYLSSWHGGSCPALGVRVYDLRNPRRPRLVSTFADKESQPKVEGSWQEKTIVRHVSTPSFKGELAVTSFQACHPSAFQGFGLYDVTRPAHPKPLSLFRTEPRGSHEIWLAAKGRHAYVYTAIPSSELISSPDYDPQTHQAQTPGEPDFRIYDVTDPAHPVKVGEWGAWKKLGINPNAGGSNFVHSVITNPSATRAFLSYWNLGTVILDVSDPSNPRYVGRTPAAHEQADAHSAALGQGGKLLVETHETSDGHPSFYDISDPAHPRWLSDLVLAGGPQTGGFINGVHDPKVRGNLAYFSWYERGVVVADISKPSAPRVVAQFVPPAARDREQVLCSGGTCTLVWGVYPEADYVLASDIITGLWVLRLR